MKIAICTPAYDGRAHLAHHRSVRALSKALEARGDEVVELDASRSANLPRLRNGLAAEALGWGADALLWIDSDIAFRPLDALALLDRPEALVGGAPQKRPKRLDEPVTVAYEPHDDGSLILCGDLLDVECVPTAFLKTHRSVFERLAETGAARRIRRQNVSERAQRWYRNYFWYELRETGANCPYTGEPLYDEDGEDNYFCRRAIEAGVSAFLDPRLRLLHHGDGVELPVCLWDMIGPHIEKALQDTAA